MGKFVIGSSADGYRFLLESFKGEVLGISPFFHTEEEAMNSIKRMKTIIPDAKIYDETEGKVARTRIPRFVVYKDANDMFRFSLEEADGTICFSSPTYTSFRYCVEMVSTVKALIKGNY